MSVEIDAPKPTPADAAREPPDFLAPYPVERFFAESWERSTLVIRRGNPDHFRRFVTLDELDSLASSITIPPTNFNLARGDVPLPQASYCVANYVDKERALAHHEAGATIILRAAEQWSLGLTRLRAHAEEFFGAEAQLNAYLTPPSEKSTPPHWDTHDLFVCQVHGSKRWRLFQSARSLPLAGERFQIDSDEVGPLSAEITLHAGDTLYLPRGTIHEPVAETYSAHVSIGVLHPRWHDVALEVLQIVGTRERSPLRSALVDLGRLDAGPEATAIGAALAAAMRDPAILAEARERMQRRFSAVRTVDRSGRLREVAAPTPLDARTRFARRPGVVLHNRDAQGSLQLCWNDNYIAVQPRMRAAVDHIATHALVTPAELPGDLSDDERTALCYALLELGAFQALSADW